MENNGTIAIETKTIRDTSTDVAKEIIHRSDMRDNMSVLEPSCGSGKLFDVLVDEYRYYGLQLQGVELNKDKCEEAKSKGYSVVHGDFLSLDHRSPFYSLKFDRIIAAPPFINGMDLTHIRLMYDYLKPFGIMSTLTKPIWMIHNEPYQVEFRKWLQDKKYSITMLPDGSFMEKGKTVPTAILKITK